MLDKLSLRLSSALVEGDLALALALFQHLFDLRESEPTPALILDHLGLLEIAPGPGSALSEFFLSVDEPLACAYAALEPLRFGGYGLDVQLRSASHLKEIGCRELGDIAYSRVETGEWGLDHFVKLNECVGTPHSYDFVAKMAESASSWKGLRSDFVALIGFFLQGGIENPFIRISQERVEAVIWSLNALHERGIDDIERQKQAMVLCRQAYRKSSDKDFSNMIINLNLEKRVFIRACPELQDQVFMIDLGL